MRSEGHGFDLFVTIEWDDVGEIGRGRPKRMRNFWYDCVREDGGNLYIGEALMRRVDS